MSVCTKCVAAATLSVVSLGTVAVAAPSAYQTAVLNSSPAVYYRFNESPITAGTTAAPVTTSPDLSGHGYAGNYIGTTNPTSVVGVGAGSDNAVSMDGVSQLFQSTDTAFGSSILNSSYEFVFKANSPTALATGNPVLFGEANGTGTQQVQATYLTFNQNANGNTTANSIRFYIRTTQNAAGFFNQFSFSSPALYDGNYHDLLLTYTNGTGGNTAVFTAYVDGVAIATTTAGTLSGAAVPYTYYPAFAGNDFRTNNGGNFAPVTLDEGALYASTLTAADALAHAQAAGLPEPASLGLLAVVASIAGRRPRRV